MNRVKIQTQEHGVLAVADMIFLESPGPFRAIGKDVVGAVADDWTAEQIGLAASVSDNGVTPPICRRINAWP